MDERASREDLRTSIDSTVHASLQLATLVVGALLVFFVVVDLYITPPPHGPRVATADLIVATLFFAAHMALRRQLVRPAHTHALGAILAVAISLTTLHDTWLLDDPIQTTYLMLVVLGAGSLFLSSRALFVVLAATFGGWLAIAFRTPGPSWTSFGFALFASCVLAILIHTVRVSTFERLEGLRLAESGRKEQLEVREKALESAVRALQESEDRYRRLVEGAPDGFLVIRGREILYANPTAVKMFGAKSAADLLGIDALRLVHPEDKALVGRRTANVQAGTAAEPVEIRCLRLDGSVFPVEVIGQPITYLGQPADQTVIRDVTDRKRAEEERAIASERLHEISRLKEMDRVKTQFVNTVSHELRTPLTPIKVQLHILKASKDPIASKKATDVLDRNVARLASLVDELLEVARIQAGTLRLVRAPVDLSSTIHQAVESFVDVARQSRIELRSEIEPDIPVFADAKRIQQVMYNLLGNSFKFTEPGGSVRLVVRRDGDHALVSMEDTGVGLDPADIGRLFEPFSQVHDPMQKTRSGTGLGLYICRAIVEGHNGRIWAESKGRGRGATFSFTLPLARGDETPDVG